jgi:hypothetical protein
MRRIFVALAVFLTWAPAFATESADGYTLPGAAAVVDANGDVWTFGVTGAGGNFKTLKDGVQFANGLGIQYYYHNHTVYAQSASGPWYAAGATSWTVTSDPRQQQSANCTGTVWCDDFNSLDAGQHMDPAHKWGYAAPYPPDWDGTTNTGAATAINPLYSATTGAPYSNLYTTDGAGNLLLNIDNAPSGCGTTCRGQPYIEGQLIATTLFGPGHYFEVRAKVPPTPGTNFALWLYEDYTATGGHYQEIDLLEAVRAVDNSWILTSQTIHHDNNTAEGYQDWSRDPTQWHTYGAYWTPTSICLYIDRVQTYCNAQSVAGYTGNMWLYLSSQSGGSWSKGDIPSGTPLPVSMTIDYARVYDHKPF